MKYVVDPVDPLATKLKYEVICPYCKRPATFVTGEKVYPHRRDLWTKGFYECEACDARCGCYGNTTKPLGRLANAELRRAKMEAHATFDPLWRSRQMGRTQAYAWLAEELEVEPEACHIGMFDLDMCARVIEVSWKKRGH